MARNVFSPVRELSRSVQVDFVVLIEMHRPRALELRAEMFFGPVVRIYTKEPPHDFSRPLPTPPGNRGRDFFWRGDGRQLYRSPEFLNTLGFAMS